jgi:hypothetical protein
MIWTEELPASLDQSAGVIIFHRIEPTRPQQLAQILAEKVGAMVEQNEKALDIRLGGGGSWGDRADGMKGDKRGEQTQERRGRGERTRGTRGGRSFFVLAVFRATNERTDVGFVFCRSAGGTGIALRAGAREPDESTIAVLHVLFMNAMNVCITPSGACDGVKDGRGDPGSNLRPLFIFSTLRRSRRTAFLRVSACCKGGG